MKIDDIGTVEYLGVNVNRFSVIDYKTYYFWDGRTFPINNELLKYLSPFDFCLRNNKTDYSISSFIHNPNSDVMERICDIITDKYGVVLTSELIFAIDKFCGFDANIHYSPILSFKYSKGYINGFSFYVSALKEKSRMFEYLDCANKYFIDVEDDVMLFINNTVKIRYADLYLISWDYDMNGLKQNKIYLKIKDRKPFEQTLFNHFPFLSDKITVNDNRFSVMAFCIKNNRCVAYNLYFKPL